MRNDKEINTILDLVAGYHRSIKLELERGGFGADVFHSETKLYDFITSDTENYMCDWSSNKYLTQQAANFIDYCFNYMRNNEDSISKKSNYYLTVLEFLDNCLNNIKLTTGIEPKPERQVTPEPQPIPKELDSPEAKKYFEKAIELGLMDNNYKWLKGLQMAACFAREMSLHFHLGKGEDSNGSPRISWKPFEYLFGLENGKLRSNYNDIQKIGRQPIDAYLIDKVFE